MTSFQVPRLRRLLGAPLLLAAAALAATVLPAAAAPPSGHVTIAWHVTLSPSWFDPSTAPPQITPFGMLYAIHDALVLPLPLSSILTVHRFVPVPVLSFASIRAGPLAALVSLVWSLAVGVANSWASSVMSMSQTACPRMTAFA